MMSRIIRVTRFYFIVVLAMVVHIVVQGQVDDYKRYVPIVRKFIYADYKGMFRKPDGALKYPFITPGSEQYSNVLWDWDSWLSNIALRQILLENGTEADKKDALQYEMGCVQNFLAYGGYDGWIPILIGPGDGSRYDLMPTNPFKNNMHKPVLAQHAAFITQINKGDAEWLRDGFYNLQAFVNNYRMHHRHRTTGLYFWQDDRAIGVDNDPSTYYRPKQSSGSIYLNCLMYKELLAMSYLAKRLNQPDLSVQFQRYADELKAAVQKHCWDERDGFYYSVDLNLVPQVDEPTEKKGNFILHSGDPRDYDCLIQRIGVWSGFLTMWSGIATPEQAKRMVREHLLDARTFNSPSGVRTLSKLEKMYSTLATGNPSNWRGPVWGISNYMVFRGLVGYGFENEARDLAAKTIVLFGKDFERFGALHEYYEPETGEALLNKGFQNWNYLVLNMCAYMEEKKVIEEF